MRLNYFRQIPNKLPSTHLVKMPQQQQYVGKAQENNVKDSPYISNYVSKKKKSKENRGSKDNLKKSAKRKDEKGWLLKG